MQRLKEGWETKDHIVMCLVLIQQDQKQQELYPLFGVDAAAADSVLPDSLGESFPVKVANGHWPCLWSVVGRAVCCLCSTSPFSLDLLYGQQSLVPLYIEIRSETRNYSA